MNLLLDTQVVVWMLSSSGSIPRPVRETIVDGANALFVSAVSTWELAIKSALGKIDLDLPRLVAALDRVGAAKLPVTIEHTLRVRDLPRHHRDPFDRLLIAQALEEGATIVSADRTFGAYAVPVLWA